MDPFAADPVVSIAKSSKAEPVRALWYKPTTYNQYTYRGDDLISLKIDPQGIAKRFADGYTHCVLMLET